MIGERPATLESTILHTKFFVPRWRSRQVRRTRLVEALERGVEAKLTLVSAPAGFGKTTLLAEWLATNPTDGRLIAWLSLDSGDSHPATFWMHLVAALQTAAPDVGASAAALLQSSPSAPASSFLPGLLNQLSGLRGELVLILDDFHVIESPDVQEGL